MISGSEDALEALLSDIPDQRLAGARWLTSNATDSGVEPIRSALQRESVPWVRAALKSAIAAAQSEEQSSHFDQEQPEELSRLERDMLQNITGKVTGQLLHEIRPLVGRLGFRASKEFPNYSGSESEQILKQIGDVLDGIDELGHAASHPFYEEFDLAEFAHLMSESCRSEFEASGKKTPSFGFSGPEHLVVVSDQKLLALAVSNGIRNAVEASPGETDSVIITWGASSTEYWVSVIDRGPGPSIEVSRALKLGVTTKTGHVGMGLSVALQAIRSLGGSLDLAVGRDGLTHFDLNCPLGYRE